MFDTVQYGCSQTYSKYYEKVKKALLSKQTERYKLACSKIQIIF